MEHIIELKKCTPYCRAHCGAYYAPLCSRLTLSRQKRKEEEIWEILSVCVSSLEQQDVHPWGLEITLKWTTRRQTWNCSRWIPWGKRLHSHKNLFKDKNLTWKVEISEFIKALLHHRGLVDDQFTTSKKIAQDIGSSSSLGKFVRVPVGESIFYENVLTLIFWKHILGHIAYTMC